MPSNPYDAKGLLIASIENDDPVIFLEPKRLYNGPFDGHHDRPVTPWSKHPQAQVPDGYYTVPLDKAAITRPGKDVTVLTYGTTVYVSQVAAEETGVDAEVIDLRSLWPLDLDTIVESVKKTGRCVVVHEATRTCGFGAELVALVQEHCFHHLEAPIERVTGWDTPYPHAQEWAYFPGPSRGRGIETGHGGLNGHARHQDAGHWRRHRGSRTVGLARQGRRHGRRRPGAGRRDDRQGHGGYSLAGPRQGDCPGRPAGGVMAVGSVLISIEVEGAAIQGRARGGGAGEGCSGGRGQPAAVERKPRRPLPLRPRGPRSRRTPAGLAGRAQACAGSGHRLRLVRSGPAGRILHEDLDAYMPSAGQRTSAAAPTPAHDEAQIPVIGLRRKIAQRMQDATRRRALQLRRRNRRHALEALRQHLNEKHGATRGKLTLLPFLVRAMVVALRDFPQINARYDDEAQVITRLGAVHVGVATQSDNGLMVPVCATPKRAACGHSRNRPLATAARKARPAAKNCPARPSP
jgi:hypothetical protein